MPISTIPTSVRRLLDYLQTSNQRNQQASPATIAGVSASGRMLSIDIDVEDPDTIQELLDCGWTII
jgi:hypothetical protein